MVAHLGKKTYFLSTWLEDEASIVQHDKHEDNPKYKSVIEEANREADEYCATQPNYPRKWDDGYCHAFWSAKKRILLEKYHLKWKSPVDLNPGVKFD